MKIYTGIGSRETPERVLRRMEVVAKHLSDEGWTLRSGGADGADSAFERGHSLGGHRDYTEVYLPWRGFNGRTGGLHPPSQAAMWLAEGRIPYWSNIRKSVRLLLARNMHQVLGHGLDEPSTMLLCWTPGGKMQGGTRYALSLAQDYDVPIFNFADHDSYDPWGDVSDWMATALESQAIHASS